MSRIVCISCVKSKTSRRSRAEDLYIGPLFRKSLRYAKSLNPDQVFVLSAEHGLLKLDQQIDPYERTLLGMPKNERMEWSRRVLSQLNELADLQNDEFIFLASRKYREFLQPAMTHVVVPMEGLRIGEQLQWLDRHTDE